MGGHEVVESNPTTEKCRLRPLSRVARLTCRFRGRPQQDLQTTGQTCSGPTFLHNLLPILEPFLLLDPKLLFIEDHILGRQQKPRSSTSFKVPASLDQMRAWVKEAATPCECDECVPWLYQLGANSSHGLIRYRHRSTAGGSKRFCKARHFPRDPQPKLNLRLYGEYEAMHLVRHHVAWLDKAYLQKPSDKDSLNVLQLKGLLRVWNPNLTGQDMRQSMSSAQSLHLITLLNEIFFFGAIPPHRQTISSGFSWLPDSEKTCFGIGTFNPIIGTQLLLHPTLYRHEGDLEDLDVRWRNRLGTILHELCHAFLKAYTCRSCPMHDHCIGPRGHGRAWQILAAKIEEVSTRLVGGYVDMGRWPSLLHDFEGHGRVPSAHDLEVLRFGTRWEGAEEK